MSIYVKDDGTYKKSNFIHVNQSGTWSEVKAVFVNDGGVWKEAYVVEVNVSLDGLVQDFNLWNQVVSQIGTKTYKIIANVTMATGTNIVSTSNTSPAFNVGSFPANSIINLNVSSGSSITGRGGNGGKGSNSEGWAGTGYAGSPGGTAIYTRHTLNLTNNNLIGGGGGGGGGGSGRVVYHGAGNGGGGAGGYHNATNANLQTPPTGTGSTAIPAGYGGIGAGINCDRYCAPRAGDGTLTTGGAFSYGSTGSDRPGGNGGNLGLPGANGSQQAGYTLYVGGAAGNAIDGSSYTNIITTGTILGGQVN